MDLTFLLAKGPARGPGNTNRKASGLGLLVAAINIPSQVQHEVKKARHEVCIMESD